MTDTLKEDGSNLLMSVDYLRHSLGAEKQPSRCGGGCRLTFPEKPCDNGQVIGRLFNRRQNGLIRNLHNVLGLSAKLTGIKKVVDHFYLGVDLAGVGSREPGMGVLETCSLECRNNRAVGCCIEVAANEPSVTRWCHGLAFV